MCLLCFFCYSDRFTMGQNLAIIWSTAPLAADDATFSSRIQNWFNEVRQYAWGSSWAPKTGHYSQVSIQFTAPILSHIVIIVVV